MNCHFCTIWHAAIDISKHLPGNKEDQVTYPGNYSEVIAVSSTTQSRDIAVTSAPGFQNEICAPGEEVYSITGYEESIVTGSGTSYAAPLVSGAIALMLSLNSSLSINEVRTLLHETCTDLGDEGKDPIFGYGLLNIPELLSKIPINSTTSTTSTTTEITSTDLNYPVLIFSYLTLTFIAVVIILRGKRDE